MNIRQARLETTAAMVILASVAVAASIALPHLAMLIWLPVALILLAAVMRLLGKQRASAQLGR
ncbi:MAG: hypothetical protein JWQ43_3800 [Glaciihabitans sp.]|nr:hypothetical protein [Glaciihabitans sp.]